MTKRYVTTTKALVTVSLMAESEEEAEEVLKEIIKCLRENTHKPVQDVVIEIDPENWHTKFIMPG